jgi:hypothetical protein
MIVRNAIVIATINISEWMYGLFQSILLTVKREPPNRNRYPFAALPPDVRKGFAFPRSHFSCYEAMPGMEAEPPILS